MTRIAVIGDPHGCIEEYQQLLAALQHHSVDKIYTVGDLVDRGPDSNAVVELTAQLGIESVMGNHEQSILSHRKRWQEDLVLPKNPTKADTVRQLSDESWAYLQKMPKMILVDSLQLVLVHGGLWPKREWWQQPDNVCRAQMIHPDRTGESRWWGKDAEQHKSKRTEEQNAAEGFRRWYEMYDHSYRVVYGHSVWHQPRIHQNPGCGATLGIDTGCVFGGMLTAAIIDNKGVHFVSVKAKREWYQSTTRKRIWAP